MALPDAHLPLWQLGSLRDNERRDRTECEAQTRKMEELHRREMEDLRASLMEEAQQRVNKGKVSYIYRGSLMGVAWRGVVWAGSGGALSDFCHVVCVGSGRHATRDREVMREEPSQGTGDHEAPSRGIELSTNKRSP